MPSYNTAPDKRGGFFSTVQIGTQTVQSRHMGRRKIDAEQLAAQAALEQLGFNDQTLTTSNTPDGSTGSTSERTLAPPDRELQVEAFRKQCEEHDKLKQLLLTNPSYDKIRGNFAQCIKEAFKAGVIDEAEKKRLQVINGRGNCAKHVPERLQKKEQQEPKEEATASEPLDEPVDRNDAKPGTGVDGVDGMESTRSTHNTCAGPDSPPEVSTASMLDLEGMD